MNYTYIHVSVQARVRWHEHIPPHHPPMLTQPTLPRPLPPTPRHSTSLPDSSRRQSTWRRPSRMRERPLCTAPSSHVASSQPWSMGLILRSWSASSGRCRCVLRNIRTVFFIIVKILDYLNAVSIVDVMWCDMRLMRVSGVRATGLQRPPLHHGAPASRCVISSVNACRWLIVCVCWNE